MANGYCMGQLRFRYESKLKTKKLGTAWIIVQSLFEGKNLKGFVHSKIPKIKVKNETNYLKGALGQHVK